MDVSATLVELSAVREQRIRFTVLILDLDFKGEKMTTKKHLEKQKGLFAIETDAGYILIGKDGEFLYWWLYAISVSCCVEK